MSERTSLQERYSPRGTCFGCGPANPRGLRIRSLPVGDGAEAEFSPQPHHEAYPGAVNGGILGTLLDCHSNWTAAWVLMRAAGLDAPPCTVTAEFHVKLRRPTPSDRPLTVKAHVVEQTADRAWVEATVESGGKVTATCRGLFVAVREGHPAFHRW